jgi:hypothetical protein
LSHAEAEQMDRAAHGEENPAEPGQRKGPRHGDAKQCITDHEHERRHPVDVDDRLILADGVDRGGRPGRSPSPWLIIAILGLPVAVLTRGRLGAPDRDGELEGFARSPEAATARPD